MITGRVRLGLVEGEGGGWESRERSFRRVLRGVCFVRGWIWGEREGRRRCRRWVRRVVVGVEEVNIRVPWVVGGEGEVVEEEVEVVEEEVEEEEEEGEESAGDFSFVLL